MKFSLSIPAMVTEAKAQVRYKRQNIPAPLDLIIEIAIFVLVFLICNVVLESIADMIFLIPALFMNSSFTAALSTAIQSGPSGLNGGVSSEIINQVMASPQASIAALFATVGAIVGAIIYVRFVEGRKIRTMGIRRGHILREYLVGLIIGAVMFGAATGIAVASGGLIYGGLAGASVGMLLFFFVGFMVQGASEEVLCRGYLLTTLARRQHLAVAVLVSSCLFGAMHLLNENVAALGIVNIILFGGFEAIYLLKRGNIWGVAAIHTAWNFTQGNVFGISVSGMATQPSILQFTPATGSALMSGGAFGLEGSLSASIVLIIAIICALLLKNADPPLRALPAPNGLGKVMILPGAKPLSTIPLPPQDRPSPTQPRIP